MLKDHLSVFAVWLSVVCVHLLFGMWWGATFVNVLEVSEFPVCLSKLFHLPC